MSVKKQRISWESHHDQKELQYQLSLNISWSIEDQNPAESQVYLEFKWFSSQVGEESGLIVVVPDGIPDAESGTRTWNITHEYDDTWGWRWVAFWSEQSDLYLHYTLSIRQSFHLFHLIRQISEHLSLHRLLAVKRTMSLSVLANFYSIDYVPPA